jgi:hypothetical protein
MPETAVDENRNVCGTEGQISGSSRPWQDALVKAIPHPHSMQR